MNRRRFIEVLLVSALASLPLLGAGVEGELRPREIDPAPSIAATDLGDELAKVDLANVVRLIVPPGRHTGAEYQFSASFTGDHERCLSLFEWAGDDTGAGMWERKAFLNSRWNGNPANGTLMLQTGRSYLLVSHFKDGNPPLNTDQPWVQDHLAHDGNSASANASDADSEYPSANAKFVEDDGSATASLTFVKTNNTGRALPAN
jgi:hypothetical protein